MGDAKRRRSLGLQTPRNIRRAQDRPAVQLGQRQCLMANVGHCRLSFPLLGNEGRFMCARHWALVPEDVRQNLRDEFAAANKALEAWNKAGESATSAVLSVTNKTID